MKRPVLAALFILALAAPACAHPTGPAGESVPFEFLQIFLIGIATVLYAVGLTRIRNRSTEVRIVSRAQSAAFTCGILFLVLALLSPLDSMADALFSAHMVQHLCLILFAPPLLVWGRPALVGLWAFRPAQRKSLGTVWNRSGLSSATRVLMHPVVVAALFCASFAFWHLPRPYQWALTNESVHALEHLCFFLTSLMFWSLVIEPSGQRRMALAPTLVFVAVIGIVSGLPGALMLLSPVPLYGIHAYGAASWGLSQLEDQQLAGLIMWVPAGLFYLAPIGWLFVKLLRDSEPAGVLRSRNTALMVLLLLPVGIVGCSPGETREAERAKALIGRYGCGECHNIPGVENADGRVGPPLASIGSRIYIAGRLRNSTENMAKWLQRPQAVSPGSAMPDMGIGDADALTLANYLETLH